jgi:hypothetical protein
MRSKRPAEILAAGCAAVFLSACQASFTPGATPSPAAATTIPGVVSMPPATPIPTASPSAVPTERPTPGPEEWKSYPVVPVFGPHAAEIFHQGISLRRDSHAFSKIGDCQNITTYFLADFEHPEKYRLGPYADLQKTIDWFQGSFGRKSLSVKGGLNVASAMNPLMADPKQCLPNEAPLACELRLHNPSVVLISFEEAWDGNVEKYDTYMRKVIEYVIGQGVVPVLATKADDLEGGDRINQGIARLAWEYDIPLWNFWSAVQPLRSRGLTRDGFHLTQGKDFQNYFFDLPPANWSGWMARNLTALQVLDAAREEMIAPVVE